MTASARPIASADGVDGAARRRLWTIARIAVGGAILALLVWRLGFEPFVAGLGMVDAWSIAAALALGLVTTVCCAWRWSMVARGLGVGVPMREAVAAYYRSQFINTTVPGGFLGDVHRAVSHGRGVGDVNRGVRAVAWERSAGQVVQLALTVIVLLLVPSPVRSFMPLGVLALAALAIGALLLSRRRGSATSRPARLVRAASDDLRQGLLASRAWPGVLVASAIVVAGHAATFVIAARAAGASGSVGTLLPLALVVLLAMALPLSIGGWGPREGVAAWAFAAAGLGAAAGVATAVVYGVMVLVATLPGAAFLAVAWLRRQDRPTVAVTHG